MFLFNRKRRQTWLATAVSWQNIAAMGFIREAPPSVMPAHSLATRFPDSQLADSLQICLILPAPKAKRYTQEDIPCINLEYRHAAW